MKISDAYGRAPADMLNDRRFGILPYQSTFACVESSMIGIGE
jgi:hypothetical protein